MRAPLLVSQVSQSTHISNIYFRGKERKNEFKNGIWVLASIEGLKV
jgi:hypothetical protein